MGGYKVKLGDFNFIWAALKLFSAVLTLKLAELLSKWRFVVSDWEFRFIFWKLSLLFWLFCSHNCQIRAVLRRNEVVLG
jgi:hypothetical protein